MRGFHLPALAGFWLAASMSLAQTPASLHLSAPAPSWNADRILIQPKRGIDPGSLARFHSERAVHVLREFNGIGGLQVLNVPKGETVESLIARYRESGLVDFAEPDFEIHADAIPNDPKFLDGTLWGLNNTGQNSGMPGADIDAPEAWDVLSSASNIVVAVLDTGVRYTHEDLASNVWVNPMDGSHGWNAIAGNNLPDDDNGHGTLMAGVLGAVGNNNKGVVGVAWRVQMMACKCLNSAGSGFESDLITCIEFARTNGARVINASLDSAGFSQALSNAIVSTRDAGIIFVASAGNNSQDIDIVPHYPAALNIDNIVSVAYTTRTDDLGFLSDYGATNVDLAAPGDQIYSTDSSTDSSYYPPFNFINLAGTSYAAAYVTGAFALMLAKFPAENYQQVISRVLNATDSLASLAGRCVTGGRLNLRKALSPPIVLAVLSSIGDRPFQFSVFAGPNRLCVIETSTNLVTWTPVFTNTTSANGTFGFTNAISVNPNLQFFRAVSAL